MPEQTVERLLSIGRAGWASLPVATPVPGLSIPGGEKSILVLPRSGCVILDNGGKPITRTTGVTFTQADRIDIGRFRQHVAVFEGNVPYMYLDTVGEVTVGVGHLLEDADEAKKLPFFTRKPPGPGRPPHPAHTAHIANAFNRVLNSGLTNTKVPGFRDLTHIELSPIAVEALFQSDVNIFIPQINGRKWFPGYDFESYPTGVQLGMLDLVYNLGAKGFFDNYNQFREALKFRNWIRVANESSREAKDANGKVVDSIVDRNAIVRDWILEAINDQPFFINPGCTPVKLDSIPGFAFHSPQSTF